ncbi:MAG: hypothetical protein SNG73_06615, partial [Rikenellaceae bacterium]
SIRSAGSAGSSGSAGSAGSSDAVRSAGSSGSTSTAAVRSGAGCDETFKIGDRLQHERFGRGVVVDLFVTGVGEILSVDFEDGGVRKLVKGKAPISRL